MTKNFGSDSFLQFLPFVMAVKLRVEATKQAIQQEERAQKIANAKVKQERRKTEIEAFQRQGMQYPTNNDSSEALEKVIEPKSVSFQDEVLKKLEEEFAEDTVNRGGDELDIGNLLFNRAVSMDLSSLRPIFNDPVQA